MRDFRGPSTPHPLLFNRDGSLNARGHDWERTRDFHLSNLASEARATTRRCSIWGVALAVAALTVGGLYGQLTAGLAVGLIIGVGAPVIGALRALDIRRERSREERRLRDELNRARVAMLDLSDEEWSTLLRARRRRNVRDALKLVPRLALESFGLGEFWLDED